MNELKVPLADVLAAGPCGKARRLIERLWPEGIPLTVKTCRTVLKHRNTFTIGFLTDNFASPAIHETLGNVEGTKYSNAVEKLYREWGDDNKRLADEYGLYRYYETIGEREWITPLKEYLFAATKRRYLREVVVLTLTYLRRVYEKRAEVRKSQPPLTITLDEMFRYEPCDEEKELAQELWPDGVVPLNRDTLNKFLENGLSLFWMMARIPEMLQEYNDPGLDAYLDAYRDRMREARARHNQRENTAYATEPAAARMVLMDAATKTYKKERACYVLAALRQLARHRLKKQAAQTV